MNPEDEVVGIDASQCVNILVAWLQQKLQLLQHLNTMPDGTEVEIDGVSEAFSGDLRRGFQLGISAALAELSDLPIQFGSDAVAQGVPIEPVTH